MTDLDSALATAPVLLVGRRRPNGRIDARHVPVHDDTHDELRDLCRSACALYGDATVSPYAPHGALGEGECFSITADELPAPPKARRRSGAAKNGDGPALRGEDNEEEVASLLRVVYDPGVAERITLDELGGFSPTFTAIAYPDADPPTAFVRKASPVTAVKKGFRYFSYGDIVRSVQHPDLALGVHHQLVVTGDRVLIADLETFHNLFKDTGIALKAIPENVAAIVKRLSDLRAMTDDARAQLETVAKRRVRVARRLEPLLDRLDVTEETLRDVTRLRKIMRERDVPILDADDRFHFTDDAGVDLFLDVLEGRLYNDDLTGEPRRADKYRIRTATPPAQSAE